MLNLKKTANAFVIFMLKIIFYLIKIIIYFYIFDFCVKIELYVDYFFHIDIVKARLNW